MTTPPKNKRTLWDDLADAARELADALERLVNPDRARQQRAPVPVPVRRDPPLPPRRRR
jgi:hypothetical protein